MYDICMIIKILKSEIFLGVCGETMRNEYQLYNIKYRRGIMGGY